MSVLPRQLVPVVLGPRAGDKSKKLSLPGTLTTLENYVQTKENRYERRSGLTRMTTLATNLGSRVFTFNGGNEFAATDGNNVYPKLSSGFGSGVDITQYVPEARNLGIQGQYVDMVEADGYLFFTYVGNYLSGSAVKYSVYEKTTGKAVVRDTVVSSSGVMPRIALTTSHVTIFYFTGTPGLNGTAQLKCKRIARSAITTLLSETTVRSSSTGDNFDVYGRGADVEVAVIDGQDTHMLKYTPGTDSTAVNAAYRPSVINTSSIGVMMNCQWIVHDGADGYLYLLLGGNKTSDSTSTIFLLRFVASTGAGDSGIAVLANTDSATHNYRSVGGCIISTKIYVFGERWKDDALKHNKRLDFATVTAMAVNGGDGGTPVYSVGLASDPWVYNSKVYALVNYASETTQHTLAVCRLASSGVSSFKIVAGPLYSGVGAGHLGMGGAANDTTFRLPRMSSSNSGATIVAPVVIKPGTDYELATLLFDATATVGVPKDIGGVALMPGGVTRIYDGETATEAGFLLFPEIPTGSTGGGGALESGTYRFRTVYSWKDAHGREYYSGISDAVEKVPSANQVISVTAPTLRVTDKTAVYVEIYVTGKNPGQDPPYYFYQRILNDTAAHSVSFSISAMPNSANRELYVGNDLSTLEHVAPPPSLAVEVQGGRAWVIAADDRKMLWPSKLVEEGLGVAFNDEALPIRIEDEMGNLTALCALEDKLITFKKNATYAIWGDGPDNTGNGAFSNPFRLKGTIGATSPITAKTEAGAFFQASDSGGFWIVDTNLAQIEIGRPVADVTGFTLKGIVEAAPPARRIFVATSSQTFVWDLNYQRWSIFTGWAAAGACFFNDEYTFINSTGSIYYTDSAVWTDDGTDYVAAFETSHISPGGIAGYGRTYVVDVIGEFLGRHLLAITATLDYGANTASWTFDTNGVFSSADERYHLRCPLPVKKQRSASIKVRVAEVFPRAVAANAGFAFETLVLDCGIEGRKNRLPAALKATQG